MSAGTVSPKEDSRGSSSSSLALALFKPLSSKILKPRVSATNADRVIGSAALVTETIDNTQAAVYNVSTITFTPSMRSTRTSVPAGITTF